jgi:hypothetical protein
LGKKTYKETEAEDANQTELLASAEIQPVQRRERQYEDDDIGGDVSGRVEIPERQARDACAGRLGVPEFVDWSAVEDVDQELRHGPHGDYDEGDGDDFSHGACPQDPAVLE